MGRNRLEAFSDGVLLMAGFPYWILQRCIIASQGASSARTDAVRQASTDRNAVLRDPPPQMRDRARPTLECIDQAGCANRIFHAIDQTLSLQ